MIPYVLVDGRVSACCRDYDGSLVVDDINKNKLKNMSEGIGFKSLQNAHVEGGKIDNYELCKSCYIVDSRASKIWRNIITKILFKYPNKDADFYQKFFNEALVFLKNVNEERFQSLLKKYSLA